MSFLPESFTAAHVAKPVTMTEDEMLAAAAAAAPRIAEVAAEIAAEIVTRKALPEGNVECDGCRGDGVYYGRGSVINGEFVGFTGTCFRCGGKGSQTPADVKRNDYYDNRVRRYNVGS